MARFRPKFNPWHFGHRHRYFVTLFPNSFAPGLNLIAYGLMSKTAILPLTSMIRFSSHMRARRPPIHPKRDVE